MLLLNGQQLLVPSYTGPVAGWAGRWQLRFLGVSAGDNVLAGGISSLPTTTLPPHG